MFDYMHTGGVHAVNVDGTGARVLFTAPEEHQVFDAFVEGADVCFPMTQPVEGQSTERVTFLWRMPITGGEPTLFSQPEGGYDQFAEIFASDASSLYLESSEQVVRVSKQDGTAVVIADIGLDIVDQAQLFEGKVWFTTFQGDGLVRSMFAKTPSTGSSTWTATRSTACSARLARARQLRRLFC